MDFTQQFLHQEVTHLSTSLKLISQELIILNEFLKIRFKDEWRNFYDREKAKFDAGLGNGGHYGQARSGSGVASAGPVIRRKKSTRSAGRVEKEAEEDEYEQHDEFIVGDCDELAGESYDESLPVKVEEGMTESFDIHSDEEFEFEGDYLEASENGMDGSEYNSDSDYEPKSKRRTEASKRKSGSDQGPSDDLGRRDEKTGSKECEREAKFVECLGKHRILLFRPSSAVMRAKKKKAYASLAQDYQNIAGVCLRMGQIQRKIKNMKFRALKRRCNKPAELRNHEILLLEMLKKRSNSTTAEITGDSSLDPIDGQEGNFNVQNKATTSLQQKS